MGVAFTCNYCGKKIESSLVYEGPITEFQSFMERKQQELSDSHECRGDKQTIKIPAIETWPITHLRKACKKNKVKGYTKMNRNELIAAVKEVIKGMQ